jgi:predicted ATPase
MGRLVSSFRKAQQGESQAVIVVGEASIGKTRLTGEFVT